jgi:hypothetical protein
VGTFTPRPLNPKGKSPWYYPLDRRLGGPQKKEENEEGKDGNKERNKENIKINKGDKRGKEVNEKWKQKRGKNERNKLRK